MSLKGKILLLCIWMAGADFRAACVFERELGGCSERLSSAGKRKITVAYIPVTCQLTCPVTDYISKFSENGELFLPRISRAFPK